MRTRLFVQAGLAAVAASSLSAQSLLYRSPNLSGDWVPDAGVVQFNFVHRFYVASSPSHAIINFPSFVFAVGTGRNIGFGYRFATKSPIQNGSSSNESELYARWRFLGQHEGPDGLAVSVSPAYNFLAKSFDAEVAADWTKGPITVLGAVRELTKPFGGSGAQTALAGGVVLRINPYIALAGDFSKLLGGDTAAAWSAGIHVGIPGSPHTFALQVTNVTSNTYQGGSRGVRSGPFNRLYGFEFTIPVHVSRFGAWFHPTRSADVALGVTGTAAANVYVSALKFPTDTTRVSAGEIVRWTNGDPLDHTITFDGEGATSGPLPTRGSYAVRFDRAGTYTYHCTPHPFMKGVVVVR